MRKVIKYLKQTKIIITKLHTVMIAERKRRREEDQECSLMAGYLFFKRHFQLSIQLVFSFVESHEIFTFAMYYTENPNAN